MSEKKERTATDYTDEHGKRSVKIREIRGEKKEQPQITLMNTDSAP